jgi:hypothetical protein
MNTNITPRRQTQSQTTVCTVESETLTESSKVYDVVFAAERIFCRDEKAAITLQNAVHAAIQNAL